MAYPSDPIYKFYRNLTGQITSVFVTKDGKEYSIPFDENNTDYQDYLKWVAEGNTAQDPD